jgi:hypothetical protein
MPIIRGAHDFEESFTRLPNRWLRDQRLSLKAIGLLAQLHSHSVGWKLSITTLAKANNTGLEAIRTAIRELEQAGYLKRSQGRTENNKFAEAIWETCDPLPDFPASGFPSSGFPTSGNPTPKKNNVKNNQDQEIYKLFSEFWKIYPRRVAVASARKAFLSVCTESNKEQILAGAKRLSEDPNLPPAQFIPYPQTWLRREGWLDPAYPERQLTREELEEQERAKRLLRQDREREASRAFLEEQKQLASSPPPICKHNKNLILCQPCLREQANQ